VSPNEETDHRDGDTRTRNEGITEDRFARERRDNLADHAHRRQNHDVYGRMRIKPEQMLEKNGIAAHHRIEKAQVKHAFETSEQQRDGDDRRPQNENYAGG